MVLNSVDSLDKVSEDGFESMRDVPRVDEDELVSRESPSWVKLVLKSIFELAGYPLTAALGRVTYQRGHKCENL